MLSFIKKIITLDVGELNLSFDWVYIYTAVVDGDAVAVVVVVVAAVAAVIRHLASLAPSAWLYQRVVSHCHLHRNQSDMTVWRVVLSVFHYNMFHIEQRRHRNNKLEDKNVVTVIYESMSNCTDWRAEWLINQQSNQSVHQITDWRIEQLTDWWSDRGINFSVNKSINQFTDQSCHWRHNLLIMHYYCYCCWCYCCSCGNYSYSSCCCCFCSCSCFMSWR